MGSKTVASRSRNTQVIVDAACALFKEKSYEVVSVRDICARAGVSSSSFYSVFSNKDEIVAYTIRNLKDDTGPVVKLLLGSSSDLEKIWRLYDRILKYALQYGPEFVKSLMLVSSGGDDVTKQFYLYSDWFAVLVRNCQEAGVILNREDPGKLVKAASTAAFGVAYEWIKSHGILDLREESFRCHESIYNVAPEYRGIWKNM